MDATTAINQAWRAAGGFAGPMGARQGGQSTVGDGGVVQAYAGGKIYYTLYWRSRGDGRNSVEVRIVRGPTGDLGFLVATEADGGAPNSRVTVFSASDKPVIFWTPDNGAIIVRGAINAAAWTKLGGAAGKLGVPTSERSVDGDTITQKFSGGEISWNQDTNTFSTKPADLAASLSGSMSPRRLRERPRPRIRTRASPGTGGGCW